MSRIGRQPITVPAGVKFLDDPDENGRYRKSKIFHMGWNLASGMVPGYDGVYVVQPPYLLFYADNCDMVYGDAQAALIQMIEAVRGLGLPAAA